MSAAPSRDSSASPAAFQRAAASVGLSPLQARFLAEMYARRGATVSHAEIMDALYPDADGAPYAEIIKVVVHHIRAKTAAPDIIVNHFGSGYSLAPHGVAWLDDETRTEAA